MEKVDSDLNYAIERLGNEFCEAFSDEMKNEVITNFWTTELDDMYILAVLCI